jgi:hypothetical protein
MHHIRVTKSRNHRQKPVSREIKNKPASFALTLADDCKRHVLSSIAPTQANIRKRHTTNGRKLWLIIFTLPCDKIHQPVRLARI